MIDILLATYNGQDYVREQIDSLLAQSIQDWRLYIRDDASTDFTRSLCQQYVARYPDKMVMVQDSLGNLGVRGNFGELIEHSSSDYTMFCDQDDVWLPDKIEVTWAAIKAAETERGKDVPIAIYTDLKLVDAKLSPVCDSLFKHTRRNPNVNNRISRLCMASCTYGCTMMINRKLRSLCAGFPQGVHLWDLWLSMIAAAFGSLVYVDRPTVLYRRHGRNISGAAKAGLLTELRGKDIIQSNRRHIYALLLQHKVFYQTFRPILNRSQEKILADIASIPTRNWGMRRYLILKHRLFKTGFVKNLGMLLVV